jgi:hypothetical protein
MSPEIDLILLALTVLFFYHLVRDHFRWKRELAAHRERQAREAQR